MKKIYKKIILLATIAVFNLSNAQTNLVAGDIAITGYIGNGTVAGTDQFSFVLLNNITSGTIINFTDNAWLRTSATTGSFNTGEGIATWTAQSALSSGSEVTILLTSPNMSTTTRFQGTNLTSGTVTGTALSLSANGDQIIAYQGTVSAPTFISAIHSNVYTNGIPAEPTTTAAIWDGNYVTLNASGIPTGLTTGVNAIWIGIQGDINSEKDNTRFNCGSFDLSTVAKIKALIYNQANWTTSDNAPGFTIPTDCGYMAPFLAIDNFDFENKIRVFPNPFSNEITIYSDEKFDTIEMYSVLGKKVIAKSLKNTINTSQLAKGVYFLKLTDINGKIIVRKVIKH